MGYHDIFKGTHYFVGILLLISVSTVSNTALLSIIVKSRKLRTVPNAYISSIALANIFAGIFKGISVTINTLSLAFDSLFCLIFQCLDRIFLAAGIFSVIGLCLDRYRFYVSLVPYEENKTRAKKSLVWIWISSFAYGIVLCVTTLAITQNGINTKNQSCGLFKLYPKLNATLRIVDLVTILTTAVVLTTFSICKIAASMKATRIYSTPENHKKSLRLLLAVAVLEWFANVPFFLYEIVHDLTGSFAGHDISEDTEDKLKLCTVLLSVLSFTIMPLIYFAFSEQIRSEVKKLHCMNKVHDEIQLRSAQDCVVEEIDI